MELSKTFVTIHGLGAAHSNHSGRYWKFAPQNRPSLLNHVLTECAVYAHSWPVNSNKLSFAESETNVPRTLQQTAKSWASFFCQLFFYQLFSGPC